MADRRTHVNFYGIQWDSVQAEAKGELSCKFLQVSDGDDIFLLVGPISEYPYHAGLLERFCRDRSVISEWVQRPDLLEIYDKRYRVLGGGYLEVDVAQRVVRLSGLSKAYGGYDRRVMKAIKNENKFFGGFAWSFE
jgi:hypothetical protein